MNKIRFDIYRYLYIEEEENRRDYLIKKYDNFLLRKKLNKEEFEKILYEVLENKKIKDADEDNTIKEDSEILIGMESPLFVIISKTKAFENYYSIYISQKKIDKYKLKDDYKKYFENLNKLKIKYSSIYYKFEDEEKINYLKQLNIDFNKIKRITLIKEKENNRNKEIIFETLFSLKGIENNLIYLKIVFTESNLFEFNLFQKINNFKSLRNLYVSRCGFNSFTIGLKNMDVNLEILDLERNKISNIDFLKNVNFKELKELNLYWNKISDIKVLEEVKFEKLKKLNLGRNKISNINILEKTKFKELKELKLNWNGISDIKVLEKVKIKKLEILDLNLNKISNIDCLENANFKELKELYLNENIISNIKVLEKVIL